MSMINPPLFHISHNSGNKITLTSNDGDVAHLFVLEQDIVRVMVLPAGKQSTLNSWAIAPGQEDVATEGRDRFDLSGFALPSFKLDESGGKLKIETAQIRLTVALSGFFCNWEILQQTAQGSHWVAVASDRPTQAYNFGYWDERCYHYLVREPGEMYFGLGERAGDTNRAGQSHRMTNINPLGYNAKTTDTLYKHIPFYITWKPELQAAFGVFYDTLSDCTIDMGREIDQYHFPYRHFIADHGILDYYIIAGDARIDQVVRRYTWLTGRPAFMPKWSLGYSGSTMLYTEAANAQERMGEFLEKCAEHDILCDSFHLSSGYTTINGKRYVFNWNHDKFPDAKGFASSYMDKGVHLVPNIKPALLRSHPLFDEALESGLLMSDTKGQPGWIQYWGEVGVYLDFTNPKTLDWWKEKVKTALLEYGLSATWNDNNEFEIWSDKVLAKGFGSSYPVREAKILQTLLMMRASRQAQQEFSPEKRPYVVTRGGMAGMQRYAQTWSGDNTTSWQTLKYNIKMGLGLALSGVSNSGHDIGGFFGPAPDQELFIRWVQFGIFLPRFSIHSWNTDGSVNEPWMFPQATHHVRDLIKLRAKLTPYLYDLLWQAHDQYQPVTRPTFFDFPQDARCFEENDDLMIGRSLLFAPVVEAGQRTRDVYLPAGSDWIDFWSGDRFEGGQTVTLAAPWSQPPLLVREGSAIPVNLAEQHFAKPDCRIGFMVFPHRQATEVITSFFDDDGESYAYRQKQHASWTVTVKTDAHTVDLRLAFKNTSGAGEAQKQVKIILPGSEHRAVTIAGKAAQLVYAEEQAFVMADIS
ncbi:MAG: glycoside hydrolase family 31 protein [Collimonas sp.]|uniref:glycoside hydrolase family 31 protein n=1 Tax=Collimonas sp. TaxID=1963772 RepID=UPI0032663CEE